MRIHSSSAVTIAVTLLFVSGTIGCHSNGGAWYNPKSYTWSNPFSKKNEAPSYSSAPSANPKPSLDSSPNVEVPHGGYTDGTSSYASRTGSQSGISGGYNTLDQGKNPSPALQGTTNPYGGGYSVAETSSYPPPYAGAQQGVDSQTVNQYQYAPATAQNNPASGSYPPETAPLGNSPYGNSNYGAGTQYQPATSSYASADPYGSATPAANSVATNSVPTGGNYAPFGTTTQQDPYAAPGQQTGIQQPAPASPAGGYYDQSQPTGQQPATVSPANAYYNQPTSAPYTNEAVPPAAPYQPYPSAQPATGYSY